MGDRFAFTGLGLLGLALAAGGCDRWFGSGSSASPSPTCDQHGCCTYDSPQTSSDAGLVPPRPDGPAATGAPSFLAVSHVDWGNADRSGNSSPHAWQKYGLNLDGKVTTVTSTDVCTHVPGTDCSVQLDGDNGIDNSFGANLIPIIFTFNATFDTYANDALRQGGPTTIVQLDGSGSAANASVFDGALYRAMPAAHPSWRGTDVRDFDRASLLPDAGLAPAAAFSHGYMSGRTWVGEPPAAGALLDLYITSSITGDLLPPLPIEHLRVVMQVSPDGGSATSGTLAGVLRTSDAVYWMKLWADGLSSSLCNGTAVASIATQIEQVSDIMADGTNAPGQQCDAISVGLGFDAVAVRLGQPQVVPPFVNECPADGGVDGEVDAADDGADGD